MVKKASLHLKLLLSATMHNAQNRTRISTLLQMGVTGWKAYLSAPTSVLMKGGVSPPQAEPFKLVL